MKTKEEYYKLVLKNRKLAANPKLLKCSCPNTLCDWHGKCQQCVALHVYHNDHVPKCLQPVLQQKIKELAAVVELDAVEKPSTPIENRQYVEEKDQD